MARYPIKAPMVCPECQQPIVIEEDGTKLANFRIEHRVAYLIADGDDEDDTRELYMDQTVLVCVGCGVVVSIIRQAT